MALQPPLPAMVERTRLIQVEPDQADNVLSPQPMEQVLDLKRGLGSRAHTGLCDQYRSISKFSGLRYYWLEDVLKGLAGQVVVTADAHPVDVLRTGPEVVDRTRSLAHRVDLPKPLNVRGAVLAEDVHDVPPGSPEVRSRSVVVTPRLPEAIHLMPEADHNRTPESRHFLSVSDQIAIIAARRYPRQRDVGRVDLHDCRRAIPSRHFGECRLEWLEPAAVIGNEVGVPAYRPRELSDPRVGLRRIPLVDAEIADRCLVVHGGRTGGISGELEGHKRNGGCRYNCGEGRHTRMTLALLSELPVAAPSGGRPAAPQRHALAPSIPQRWRLAYVY